jgi:hypothetical protein
MIGWEYVRKQVLITAGKKLAQWALVFCSVKINYEVRLSNTCKHDCQACLHGEAELLLLCSVYGHRIIDSQTIWKMVHNFKMLIFIYRISILRLQ